MFRRFLGLVSLVFVTQFLTLACGSDDGGTAPPAVTVSFSTQAPTISEGDTLTVVASASNGASVTYTSSNTGVAAVSASGVVTGISPGTATITASSGSATATLEVTVQAFLASVTIDQITQDGAPIDPSDVSGTLTVDVSVSVTNTFVGEVAVFLGGFEVAVIPINQDSGGGELAATKSAAFGAAEAMRRVELALRTEVLSVVAIKKDEYGAEFVTIANGPQDLSGNLRGTDLPAEGVASTPTTLNLNNPPRMLFGLYGKSHQNADDPTLWWRPEEVNAYWIDPTSELGVPTRVEMAVVNVVTGETISVFGSGAVDGVFNFPLDLDQPAGSGNRAFGDLEEEHRWGISTITFAGGTTIEGFPLNFDIDEGLAELARSFGFYVPGRELYFDTQAPRSGPEGVRLADSALPWLKVGLDLNEWSRNNLSGLSSQGFVENGSGFGACNLFYASTDGSNFFRIENSDELEETWDLSIEFQVGCGDNLGNYRHYTLEENFGVDGTAPTTTQIFGSGYFDERNINPAEGLSLGYNGTDTQSGLDPNTILVWATREDADGKIQVFGSINEEGEKTFAEVPVSKPGTYTPGDGLTATGLIDVSWALQDRAGNVSTATSFVNINDSEPPLVTSLAAAVSIETPGQPFSISAEVSDNLGLAGFSASVAIGSGGAGFRYGIGRGSIWDEGQDLVQSYSPGGTVATPGSIEVLETRETSGSTPFMFTGVFLGVEDLAENGVEAWENVNGAGSTVSFGDTGMDRLDFSVGAANIDISATVEGAPTQVATTVQALHRRGMSNLDYNAGAANVAISATGEGVPTRVATTVQALYRPGSTLRTAAAAIFAGVPERGNKDVVAWWPVTDLTPFTAFDRGTFIEVLAYPVIDATAPFFGLAPGIYALRAIVFDTEGNMIASLSHSDMEVH